MAIVLKIRVLIPLVVAAGAWAPIAFAATYQQYDLFPITLGSSWTYDDGSSAIVSRVTDSNGNVSAVIDNLNTSVHGAGSLEVAANSTEVRVVTYHSPNYIIVNGNMGYSPFLRKPMALGQTWGSSGETSDHLVHIAATVTGTNETITIGATTYHHCVEVSVRVTGDITPRMWVNNTHYFYCQS